MNDNENSKIKQLKQELLRNPIKALEEYRHLKIFKDNTLHDLAHAIEERYADPVVLMGADRSTQQHLETLESNLQITETMRADIFKMVDVYENECKNSRKAEKQRRGRVIYEIYMNPDDDKTIEDVAEEEHVDPTTIYRDIHKACEELKTCMFGILGMADKYLSDDADDSPKT